MSVELEKLHHILVQMRLEDVTGEDSRYLIAGGDATAAKLLQQLSAFKVSSGRKCRPVVASCLQASGPQEADKDKTRKEGERD